MKKAALIVILLVSAPAVFAQSWRDRPYRRFTDNSFDITPLAGYRWGGTLYGDQTSLYGQDVDLDSSAHYGLALGIPISPSGLKLELLVDRQDTQVGSGSGLFTPNPNLGDFHLTYYHAGVLIPIAERRSPRAAQPFIVVSAGVTNLDPPTAGVSSANRFSASMGIGVKVPIAPNLALRLETRGYYTSTSNHNRCTYCYYSDYYNRDLYQGEVNAGLAIKF